MVWAGLRQVRSTPDSRHILGRMRQQSADSVEEVGSRSKQLKIAGKPTFFQAGIGCGIGISFASFRRF